jgi:hypothetical protein
MKVTVIGTIRANETGGADYSTTIEESVLPLAKATKHQARENAALEILLPTLTYPDFYACVIGTYDAAMHQINHIPYDVDQYLTEVSVTGDTTATSIVAVLIYNHYEPVTDTPSDLYATLALKLAPKTADLEFFPGIPLMPYAGKFLTIGLAHYSVNPNATLSLTLGSFDDKLATAAVQGGNVI